MNTCTTPAPTNRGDQKNRPRTPLCSQTQGSRQGLSERDLRFRLAGHSLPVEVSVGRGPGHSEQVCDLLDGLLPGVVELLGELGLVGSELGLGLPDRPRGPRGGEPVVGVRHDQLALGSGEHGQHPEDRLPFHSGDDDAALLDDVQNSPARWLGWTVIGIRPRAWEWWTYVGGAARPCWKAGGRANESESVSEVSPILGWFIR